MTPLGSGRLDRSALAKSILSSRSLLDRRQDIDRLVDSWQVPFRTQLDDRWYRNTGPKLDRSHLTDSDMLSRCICNLILTHCFFILLTYFLYHVKNNRNYLVNVGNIYSPKKTVDIAEKMTYTDKRKKHTRANTHQQTWNERTINN